MEENIEVKDVQKTEYLDKNGLDMLWAKVKENTRNQVEAERNRATTQEDIIIEIKADKSELHSSYVSNSTFTALQEKVAANTDAIRDKQDAGNYLSYKTLNNEGYYEIPAIRIPNSGDITKTDIDSQSISVNCDYPASHTTITCDGISNTDNNANHVYATDGSIADLTQYAKKTDIPEVDTSDFISKTATNITTGGFGQIRTVDTINNNIGVGNNTSSLAYIGKGELGAIQYNSDGYATESFRYTSTYGLETTNTRGYKNVKIPCDQNQVQVYKSGSNDHYTKYGYSGVQLGENNDDSNLLNTNGSYKTIGTDITPLENGKVPAEYLDLSQYAKKSEITAGGNVDDVQVNGVTVVENKIANIKPATKESLGVVKVGDGLNVTDGTISVDSTAIGTGNYIPYKETFESNTYILPYNYNIGCKKYTENGNYDSVIITPQALLVNKDKINAAEGVGVSVTYNELLIKGSGAESTRKFLSLTSENILLYRNYDNEDIFRLNEFGLDLVNSDKSHVRYGVNGIVASQYQNCLATSDGAFKPISDFVLKAELPTVPTKTSQLQNDSEFITKSVYDEKIAALEARIAALEAKHAETA